MQHETVLAVSNLKKRYGLIEAVAEANITVHASEVVCLVGPNGSGKTTLIECIEGLRNADAGQITLFGRSSGSRRQRAHLIGVQLQEEGLPARIRVGEAVRLFAAIYGVQTPDDELIEQLGLTELVRRPFEMLSGGQKRRTALALAFIHDPRLAILDEPSSGLDPQGQREIISIIKQRANAGTGLLITTHNMQFAAEVADRVVTIRNGRTIANDTPDKLLASLPYTWCLSGPVDLKLPEGHPGYLLCEHNNYRLYGDRPELERILDTLNPTDQVRMNLRRVDLSDALFLYESKD
ncbi:ABC transporter ATP-binding protein [Stomatohabitans albus]